MLVIALGVVLSLLWCWAGWYYLEQAIGFENLMLFLPHEIGQFAVGFFTPLFLLWVLIVLVTLVRRVGRLAEIPGSSGGGRKRDPQIESPAPAPPKRDKPKPEPVAKTDTSKADAGKTAPVKDTKASTKKPAEAAPKGRATASASISSTDESGKVTLKKVEQSTVAGEGPVTAVARAVGRTVKGEAPPKRPAKETAPRTPPGPLPPKRPPEENVETLPRTAEGQRPPKSPKAIVESYAEAQGHTVKELNAIAMDTAALICDHDDYRASREALNYGKDDSFFELVAETLEEDGEAAAGRLREGGNRELLEAYCNKFRSLLQAAEKELEADNLVQHLKNSAPGRLYTTIESKL